MIITWRYRASKVSLLAVSIGPTKIHEGPRGASRSSQVDTPSLLADIRTGNEAPGRELLLLSSITVESSTRRAMGDHAPAMNRKEMIVASRQILKKGVSGQDIVKSTGNFGSGSLWPRISGVYIRRVE